MSKTVKQGIQVALLANKLICKQCKGYLSYKNEDGKGKYACSNCFPSQSDSVVDERSLLFFLGMRLDPDKKNEENINHLVKNRIKHIIFLGNNGIHVEFFNESPMWQKDGHVKYC